MTTLYGTAMAVTGRCGRGAGPIENAIEGRRCDAGHACERRRQVTIIGETVQRSATA